MREGEKLSDNPNAVVEEKNEPQKKNKSKSKRKAEPVQPAPSGPSEVEICLKQTVDELTAQVRGLELQTHQLSVRLEGNNRIVELLLKAVGGALTDSAALRRLDASEVVELQALCSQVPDDLGDLPGLLPGLGMEDMAIDFAQELGEEAAAKGPRGVQSEVEEGEVEEGEVQEGELDMTGLDIDIDNLDIETPAPAPAKSFRNDEARLPTPAPSKTPAPSEPAEPSEPAPKRQRKEHPPSEEPRTPLVAEEAAEDSDDEIVVVEMTDREGNPLPLPQV